MRFLTIDSESGFTTKCTESTKSLGVFNAITENK